MILEVRVIPKSSRNFVKKEENQFKVYLTKPAQQGLANTQLIELLSEFLNIKKYQIKIIKGHKARNKLVEISS
jgi:uncharacterized protein (TIGR00251 family)